MGQSFGGMTALGAAALDNKIKGCVSMDPWFLPHMKDDVAIKSDCKSLILMNDGFPEETTKIQKEVKHLDLQEKFMKKCKHTPDYQVWTDSKHF